MTPVLTLADISERILYALWKETADYYCEHFEARTADFSFATLEVIEELREFDSQRLIAAQTDSLTVSIQTVHAALADGEGFLTTPEEFAALKDITDCVIDCVVEELNRATSKVKLRDAIDKRAGAFRKNPLKPMN